MTPKTAIQILMLSPFYFRHDLAVRNSLVREFCRLHSGETETAPCSDSGAEEEAPDGDDYREV